MQGDQDSDDSAPPETTQDAAELPPGHAPIAPTQEVRIGGRPSARVEVSGIPRVKKAGDNDPSPEGDSSSEE